jgi:L-ascorbate metabolism protein UlaG (beta-lactamase superfamily)
MSMALYIVLGLSKLVFVKWWGHACFEIRSQVTVIIDPHNGKSVNMDAPKVKADIILVSHSHDDHASGKDAVTRIGSKIIDRAGSFEKHGVKISGIDFYHDDEKGAKRGKNTVFTFELDGIHFAHLGDLGHSLLVSDIEKLGTIDVLMIPVGGNYTINSTVATTIVDKIKPRIAIPMHYRVPRLQYRISDVEPFLVGKNVNRIGRTEIEYLKEFLPNPTRIDVFEAPK